MAELTVRTGSPPRPAVAVLHYALTGVGYFGLMAVLVVALRRQGLHAGEIAVCAAVFSISSKVAKIPLAVVLDRLSAPAALLLGCAVAGLSLAVLPSAAGLPVTAATLAVTGLGASMNALASKQLAARASDAAASRATVFAVINVAVNVASAVAAPLALLVLDGGRLQLLFALLGAAYLLAGLVTYGLLRGADWPPPSRQGWGVYQDVLRTPRLPQLLLVNASGWFLYAQLFNALPLYLTESLGAGAELGLLFTTNALLIVLLQVPVGRFLERVTGGVPHVMLVVSTALFAVAFLLGGLGSGLAPVVALVVVFSLAEMAFVPTVDVALLETIQSRHRAAGYSVLSVATALGEAGGAAAGLTVFAWLHARGSDRVFWFVVCGAAVLATLLATAVSTRPRREVPV